MELNAVSVEDLEAEIERRRGIVNPWKNLDVWDWICVVLFVIAKISGLATAGLILSNLGRPPQSAKTLICFSSALIVIIILIATTKLVWRRFKEKA